MAERPTKATHPPVKPDGMTPEQDAAWERLVKDAPELGERHSRFIHLFVQVEVRVRRLLAEQVKRDEAGDVDEVADRALLQETKHFESLLESIGMTPDIAATQGGGMSITDEIAAAEAAYDDD